MNSPFLVFMTKDKILFSLFAVFLMSGISHFWIFNDNMLHPGDELIGHLSVWNNRDREMKDISLTFEILNTAEYEELGKVDILPRTYYGKYIFYYLPTTMQPGDYVVKVSSKSKNEQMLGDVAYRFITIH